MSKNIPSAMSDVTDQWLIEKISLAQTLPIPPLSIQGKLLAKA